MADEELRRLERRWFERGASEAELALRRAAARSGRVEWCKLVLLGARRRQLRVTFHELTRDAKTIGRLVLHGDVFAFAVLEAWPQSLLLVLLEASPYFLETLDIVLEGEPWVVFGRDPAAPTDEEYRSQVLERVPATRLLEPAPGPTTSSARALIEGLLGPRYTVAAHPPREYPHLLPPAFGACHSGDVWGHGVGWERLRADVRLG